MDMFIVDLRPLSHPTRLQRTISQRAASSLPLPLYSPRVQQARCRSSDRHGALNFLTAHFARYPGPAERCVTLPARSGIVRGWNRGRVKEMRTSSDVVRTATARVQHTLSCLITCARRSATLVAITFGTVRSPCFRRLGAPTPKDEDDLLFSLH